MGFFFSFVLADETGRARMQWVLIGREWENREGKDRFLSFCLFFCICWVSLAENRFACGGDLNCELRFGKRFE